MAGEGRPGLCGRLALVAFALVSLSAARPTPAPDASTTPPARMIWAWERPTDLRALAGRDVGVAFYASTAVVGPDGVAIVPRRSPLRLADATYRMAVLRVEPAGGARVDAGSETTAAIVAEAVRLLALPRVRALQLDFDARTSERPTHAAIVRALRIGLPRGTFLSVTTLASHCFGDPMRGASVELPDEIVPMYFRMGGDDRVVRGALHASGLPPVERCRRSAGTADDEPRPRLDGLAREYLFLTGTPDGLAHRARLSEFLDHGAP